MPATTGTTAARTRARMVPSASRVGSYEARNARRSRNSPRVRARRPTMQNALVAWPSSGRGWARSAARPCTCARAARGENQPGTESKRRQRSCASRCLVVSMAALARSRTRPVTRGAEILVEEGDGVAAGIALRADEPGALVNHESGGREPLADARVVGHLRERPRVRPATPAAARAAVVRRFVRIVQAEGPVPDDEDERREAIAESDILEDLAHDVRHLRHGEAGVHADGRLVAPAIQQEPRAPGGGRALLRALPPRGEPGKHHAQDQGDEREPAERRHQHGAAHGRPAAQVHVVAEEPGSAALQAARPARRPAGVQIDLGDVVLGADRHGTERPRVRVADALVIHRHVEESGRAERLAGRLHLLQVAAERFLPLVEAEDGLEGRRAGQRAGCVLHERVVQARADRPLEGLLQDPAPADAVELAQFALRSRPRARALHCSTVEASTPHSCATWNSGQARSGTVGAAGCCHWLRSRDRRATTGRPPPTCCAASSSAARSKSRRTAR